LYSINCRYLVIGIVSMDLEKEWMNRVESPFPTVIAHLPPDGRTKISVSQSNNHR
jgi:hypothetical protein